MPFLLYNHLETNIPKIVTMIVLVIATRDIQNDVKSGIV